MNKMNKMNVIHNKLNRFSNAVHPLNRGYTVIEDTFTGITKPCTVHCTNHGEFELKQALLLRTLTQALCPRCPECAKVYAEMRNTGNFERATKEQPNVNETASDAVSRIAKNLPPRLW